MFVLLPEELQLRDVIQFSVSDSECTVGLVFYFTVHGDWWFSPQLCVSHLPETNKNRRSEVGSLAVPLRTPQLDLECAQQEGKTHIIKDLTRAAKTPDNF